MPKADFEFYRVEGLEGEFVLPSPASDPYHRAYDVLAIPSLALDAIAEIIGQAGPIKVHANTAQADETSGYFFNTALRDQDEVIRQKVTIKVELKAEDDFYSSVFGDVYRELSTGPGKMVLPPQKDTEDGREPAQPLAYREYAAIEDNLSILDENNKPVNPSMRIRQFVPVRAFRWLPGPHRKSKEGTVLPPTYSPRPVKLAVAQLIEVQGLNPLAVS